jgi:putative transposase
VVFCPKYRYQVLTGEVGEYVKQELYRLCSQKEVVSIPPKYAVSNIMGYLKGKLAIRVFNR